MKTTLSKSQFISDFRAVRPDNFSYEALELLFDHFEELENSLEQEIEFDPIAICCDFDELFYRDIIEQYDTDIPDDCTDETDQIKYIREWLHEQTMVVGEPFEGVFVYQCF